MGEAAFCSSSAFAFPLSAVLPPPHSPILPLSYSLYQFIYGGICSHWFGA